MTRDPRVDAAPEAVSAGAFDARVDLLIAHRWLLAGCVLVCTLLFATAALVITPVYRSSALLSPANTEKNMGALAGTSPLGGLASLAGIGLGTNDSALEESLAVLQSRQFGERFIRDHGLVERFTPPGIRSRLGLRGPEAPEDRLGRAFKYFDKNVRSVARDKKSGLITLAVDWRDPAEAADWANDMVRRVNNEMRVRAIRRAQNYLAYLEKAEATSTVVATREAIGRLIETQVKQEMMANVSEEYAFRVVEPALRARDEDRVWPPRPLFFALGPVLGFAAGAGLASVRGRRRRGEA
jgi:uncharacterized protein involved in exopolysaccharide biosynthesis